MRAVRDWRQGPWSGAVALLVLAAGACGFDLGGPTGARPPATTYEKFLAKAEAGDSESQNLIGFMLYFGEGAPKDLQGAHDWFHKAADQGNATAQRNLAIMHDLGVGVPAEHREADTYLQVSGSDAPTTSNGTALALWPENLAEAVARATDESPKDGSRGKDAFVTFCAGCHGLNGVAAYVNSPSFALGERMDKSDAMLLQSIMNGRGLMPDWGNKLAQKDLVAVLAFVRSLQQDYRDGIGRGLRPAPGRYYLFGPMENNDAAYRRPP